MGNQFCAEDKRPVLRVHIRKGEDLTPEDSNGESDAYVVFKYGDLQRNRYETKKTKIITTKDGKCDWDEIVEFHFGGLESTQNLEIQLTDHDLMKEDDIIGTDCIYYGKHPRNPDSDVRHDHEDHEYEKGKEVKHFFPLQWNVEKTYIICVKSSEGMEAGKLYLSVILDNYSAPLLMKQPEINQTLLSSKE